MQKVINTILIPFRLILVVVCAITYVITKILATITYLLYMISEFIQSKKMTVILMVVWLVIYTRVASISDGTPSGQWGYILVGSIVTPFLMQFFFYLAIGKVIEWLLSKVSDIYNSAQDNFKFSKYIPGITTPIEYAKKEVISNELCAKIGKETTIPTLKEIELAKKREENT